MKNLFNDGGPVFTYTILVLLLIIIALFVKVKITKKNVTKNIELLKSLSWFTIVWGFLGRTFGLIMVFDNVQVHGDVEPSLLAEGLKMALIDPLFAFIVFLIARVGIMALIAGNKENTKELIE